jgi:hypothetical protein
VLRVVPHRRNSVAIIVAHDQARRVQRRGEGLRSGFIAGTGVLGKQIHGIVVERLLFGGISMVLVCRGSLSAIQTERIDRVRTVDCIGRSWIARQKVRAGQRDKVALHVERRRQIVYRGRTRRCSEGRLTRRVAGDRIGGKVVIE